MTQKDNLEIAVRSFACKTGETRKVFTKKPNKKYRKPKPSKWVLVFDTETTIDAAQNLRFGTYQLRERETLKESGIFYNPDILTNDELKTLERFSR